MVALALASCSRKPELRQLTVESVPIEVARCRAEGCTEQQATQLFVFLQDELRRNPRSGLCLDAPRVASLAPSLTARASRHAALRASCCTGSDAGTTALMSSCSAFAAAR